MKKLLLSCFLLFSTALIVNAQQWVQMMKAPNANFYQIQQAFEQEWGNRSYSKGQGYKQFKRWEAFWETRVNPDGSFPKFTDMWTSYKKFQNDFNVSRGGAVGYGDWSPMGPFDYTLTDSWSPGIGRINVVAEDPNNPNTLYVGAPAGGIWKSTNGGSNWTALGDNLPVIGVSGIAIDPNNSNIVYIATGDNDGGDTYSIGIWKSTDGGATFSPTPSPATGSTGKIIIDPTNSNTLWCVSSTGVLKSTDGATTWSVSRSGNFDDIALKPGDPQTVYAVTNNKFWRTYDGGATWSVNATGLPNGVGRYKIGVSAASVNYVYALASNTGGGFRGVYRSTDSGVSFSTRTETEDVFDGSTQGWYDLALGVSQTNAETITTGVLNVHRSTNGGTSFSQLNNWSNPNGNAYTHADIHFLQYFGNTLYCGSDGGVYKSTNNGNTFTDLTPGLQIGQFYTIAGTDQTPDVLCGGLQDNGGFSYDHGVWRCYYGADGMESAVDNNDSTLIFGMIQYGDLYRSTNNGQSANGINNSPSGGNWVTPMVIDPNNNRLLAGYNDVWEYNYSGGWNKISTFSFGDVLRQVEAFDGNSNLYYTSTFTSLFKTVDDAQNWTNITNNMSAGSGITSIETHPTDPNQLWVTTGASYGKRVWYSVDGGNSYTNITANLPDISVNVIKYEVGSNGGIYIGTDIGVYYRDNNTVNWVPFMVNLPNVIVNDLEINEPAGIIRAGTYGRGVWESDLFVTTTVADDAGIPLIVTPNTSLCGGQFFPEIVLKNFGTNDLTSVDILYSFDGGTQSTYNWTGLLQPNTSENVLLPMESIGPGSHTFEITTSMPNGIPDNAPINDFNSSQFTPNITLTEVNITINTDCHGSETSWALINSNNIAIQSGGPYTDVIGGESITSTYCLPDGCYDLEVYDTGGDGLNGTQSGCAVNGSYEIRDGIGNLLTMSGNPDFGTDTTDNFCFAAPLAAYFNASRTTVCEGTNVNFFDNSSGGPTQWFWSFPGATPATANVSNPSIQYGAPGLYDVSLMIVNGMDTSTLTQVGFITVVSTPTAIIAVTDETCIGACDGIVSVTVSGGTAPFSYDWTGGLGSGELHTGVCTGVFDLVLTDENGCVAPEDSAVVNAGFPNPVTSFTASTNIVFLDQNGTVNFTNTSTGAISYVWDFGDSNTSTDVNPTHTYTVAGNYTVTLTATNTDGCSKASNQNMLVLLTDALEEITANEIEFFPNPNDGQFTVKLGRAYESGKILVYNSTGQVVVSKTFTKAQSIEMDMDAPAKGIYFLVIEGDAIRKVAKLIVE